MRLTAATRFDFGLMTMFLAAEQNPEAEVIGVDISPVQPDL